MGCSFMAGVKIIGGKPSGVARVAGAAPVGLIHMNCGIQCTADMACGSIPGESGESVGAGSSHLSGNFVTSRGQ